MQRRCRLRGWRAAGLCNYLERAGRCRRGRTTSRLIFDFGVCVQVGPAVDNLHMLKTCGEKTRAVVVNFDCPGDAADVRGYALRDRLRQFLLERDIADVEPSARFQNACDLAKHSRLVGRKVQNAVGDDAVNGRIGKRNLVNGGKMKLHVGISARLSIGLGALDHRQRHVDADGAASIPNQF